MIIDAEHRMATQRTRPRMALISPVLDSKEGTLTVSAPGMKDLSFPLHSKGDFEVLTVKVWDDDCQVEVLPEELSAWFSAFLETEGLRLVKMKETFVRPTDPKYAQGGVTTLTDGFPILIASEETLQRTNDALDEKVSMEVFRYQLITTTGRIGARKVCYSMICRPNIMVAGCRAFSEDSWRKVRVAGAVEIEVVKPCARCKIPTVHLDSGKLDPNNQPIKAMKSLRSGKALKFKKDEWRAEVKSRP